MYKSNLKLILALFVFGGLLLPAGFLGLEAKAETDTPDQSVISDLNSQIDAQRAKIDALTAKIEEYKESIKTNQKAAANLKEQVLILDNQIGKTDMDLALKEEQAKELQLKIDQTGLKIRQTEQEVEVQKVQLSDILRLIARYEDKDYVSIILANDSFSKFFDQLKYSTDLQRNLQKTLNKIKESGERLKDEEKDLNGQKKELSDILNKLESTKDVLGRQKNDKSNLISLTKQSEKKFQTLISDLKKEQAAANAQSAALEKKLRAELAKKGTTEKFNTLSNAILAWPTTSRRITATYHDPTYPFRALLGEHSGLDLGIAKGTPVMAAEAGYVAKVALGTKWYGNYIMIIHGGNITTLYGHLNSVNVTQDQYVTKGQIIGASGNTGFSSGPHLHFEVRSNGIPVDPQNYLP
jgi:murein DD-endopeptidase MepM/ murein hydrolase activator NlpD